MKPPLPAPPEPAAPPALPIRTKFVHYSNELKRLGFPLSWYLRREPRGLVIGPKGYRETPDLFELGPVTNGVGCAEGGLEGWFHPLGCEGVWLAKKFGLNFTLLEVLSTAAKQKIELAPASIHED
jgi:hypothetical protein